MFKTQYHNVIPVRIDKFLATFLTDISRSQIQDLICNQVVFKNGIMVKKAKELVSLGDIIEVKNHIKATPISQEQDVEIRQMLSDQVRVVYEHPDFLVIDKPAGLLVHKTNNPHSYSLVDILLEKYPEISQAQESDQSVEALQQNRAGIVHRIDKDTSGLIVVARNKSALYELKRLFQKRQVYKEYLCLVRGHLKTSYGHINYPIIRSKLDHTKRVAVISPKQIANTQRHAYTEYWVIERYEDSSLLKVVIHTGRTHQIRVHMKAIGHPIVGDRLYGGKLEQRASFTHIRQFLHSHKLEFDYHGESYKFISDLSQDLKNNLATHKLSTK
ncbi:MAG: hypothetical protein RLZZ223_564 [Candidatus Parcubacteria bacterium]|jgi:23S rRNA pseudouridine1911/1915/1917 synthase